jgi:Retrotransposon gag protein
MYNWENQQQLIQLHGNFHQNRNLNNHRLFNFPTYIDHSCVICYPQPALDTCSPQFQTFWNWFILNSTARRYSAKTVEYFTRLLRGRNQRESLNLIDRLLFSIRFRNREYRNTLVQLIQNCLHYTQQFTRNLNRLNNLINLDEYTTSGTETTESEEEPELTMDAAAGNILNALQTISARLAIRNNVPMPIFAGGTQDPVQWLEEFEQAAQANQYNAAYKLTCVQGYLHNEAQTWFQGVQALGAAGNFQSWDTVGNRNFKAMFLTQFRTAEKILQWRFDIQSRTQGATETVDHYAQEIK